MVSSSDPAGINPRYEVLETLGQGGMGVVYKAFDRVKGNLVALKTLHETTPPGLASARAPATEEIDWRRFDREIRALSLLHHEGIVRLHDVGQWGGRTYFTMELLAGLPLQAFIQRPLPDRTEIRWILRVAGRILDALGHLHRAGFVHRDLKPSNIMVLYSNQDGNGGRSEFSGEPASGEPAPGERISAESLLRDLHPRIKLLDFGLVKPREAPLLAARPAPGTPLYMAPEQMDPAAASEPHADLYSLGVILYQLITRRLPHDTVASALSGKPPPRPSERNPACPPGLSEAILKLLEPQPHRRFASTEELSRSLFAIGSARPEEAPPPRLLEPAFVGRVEALETLRSHLAAAASGRGRFLLVSGGRGSGKTWLLERSGIKTQAVLEHGLSYFQGRYAPGGPLHQGLREVALGMVLDLLRELGPEALAGELGPWGGALLDAMGIDGVPGLRELWPAVDSATFPELLAQKTEFASERVELASERVLQAGAALFRSAARRARLVLIDDLHEADDLDIEILIRLARGIDRLPLLLVATYRPEALELSPVLDRWLREATRGEPTATGLHLGSFTDGEAAWMARSMLSPAAEVAPTLLGELLDRTGGVPRSLREALAALWDAGRLRLEGGAWRRVPDPPQDVLDKAELDPTSGLEAEEREIITCAAVLGESFELEPFLELLSSANGPRPEAGAIARLHALTARGLLAETSSGFSFARPGLRERVEELLDPDDRRRLHERAAEALLALKGEASRDHWDSIALHFERGGRPERAREFHLRSARGAARLYANRRGIAAFRSALRLAEPAERGSIAAELARLHARIGEYDSALECFAMAEEPGRSTPTALLDEVGRIHQRLGELGAARECFERFLAMAGADTEARARARYRLGGVRFEEGDLAGASEHFQASLTISRQRGDPEGMAAAHSGLGLVEKRRDSLEAAALHFGEAFLCAERAQNPSLAATALNNLGNIRRARGEDREAIDCFRRSIELRERIGDRPGLGICLNNLSRVLGRRGELGQAAEAAARALRIFEEVGDRKGVLIASGNLGVFRLLRGDFPAGRAAFLGARGLAERLGDRRALADSLQGLGKLENSRGEPEEAERYLREGLRLLSEEEDHDLRAGVLGELATARLGQGDAEGAEDLTREGLDTALRAGSPESRAALMAVAAEIELAQGEVEKAVARAAEALALVKAGGPKFDAALIQRLLGRSYGDRGPDWVDRAEKHLGAALRLFEEMGAQFEAALTLRELGELWMKLGETGEAIRFYRRAGEALGGIEAPRLEAEIRGRVEEMEGQLR